MSGIGAPNAPCDPFDAGFESLSLVRAGVQHQVGDPRLVAAGQIVAIGRIGQAVYPIVRCGQVDQLNRVRDDRIDPGSFLCLPVEI